MIELNIPGQISQEELEAIKTIASQAPENSCIVETGSLYGLSSAAWASFSPQGSTVYCIDPWVREAWMGELVEAKFPGCPPLSRKAFEHYTAKYKNIVAIQGYSPDVTADWRKPIDIYFEDPVHWNPLLRRNLRFWLQFMKSNSIMCGHDYCEQWPDVISEVDALVREMDTRLSVKGAVWWFRVPQRYVKPIYRPLIYTTCYGRQHNFDCLSLMLKSLYVFGRYRGGILVLADRTEAEVAVPDEMTDMVRILCCDVIGPSTRFQIQEFIGACDTPVLYIDPGIIVTQGHRPLPSGCTTPPRGGATRQHAPKRSSRCAGHERRP